MQMQAAGVLIAEAEFPGAGDFAFDGEIALLRVTVFKIGGYGQSERKDGLREASGQIVLVGKKRARGERIEALLIGEIEHVGKSVEDALKNAGAIEIGGDVSSATAGGVARRRGRCRQQ